MASAGFASPGIMFLSTWARPERVYLGQLLRELRKAGYTRYREAASGAFAATLVARAAGYEPSDMEASDVWLYTAAVGTMLAGRPLAELDVRIDGEPLPLTGDPLTDTATILVEQLRLRAATKAGKSAYHDEILFALGHGRERAIAQTAAKLDEQRQRLGGLTYRAEDPWAVMDRCGDDPHAVIVANPPCYKGQYERVFNTAGRMTWNAPAYEVWENVRDGDAFMARAASAKAFVVMATIRGFGEAGIPVAFAAARQGHASYLACNRPEEAYRLTGIQAAAGAQAQMERLPMAVMPPDRDIHPGSQLRVVAIESKHSRYYRDLWSHRLGLASSPAFNWALLADDQIVGIAGFSPSTLDTPYTEKWESHLMLQYCFGAPGGQRRTKLMLLAACSRATLERVCDAWSVARTRGLVTVNYTLEPEAKGFRGTPFKLIERKKHPDFGNQLVYAAPVQDWDLEEAKRLFLESEARRAKPVPVA